MELEIINILEKRERRLLELVGEEKEFFTKNKEAQI